MNSLDKFLRLLDPKLRRRVEQVFFLIMNGDIGSLDIKPMKGYEDVLRCRVGGIRIIFIYTEHGYVICDADFRHKIYKRWK